MDSEANTLLHKILKDNKYSITKSRRVVCELLWHREPQSMHDLIVLAKGKLDRASLYRTIALYEQLGIVQRIYIGWKYKVELSDIFSHHHHHISCLSCGKIVAITNEDNIEHLIAGIAHSHGFKAQQHQLEIRGYCSSCSQGTTN